MPALPETVQVGPWQCTIVRDLPSIIAVSADLKQDIDGYSDSRTLTISIRPNLAPDMEAETLTHELLHMLTNVTGLSHDLDEDEEGFVTRLAPALLDLLRRNPKLVAYLVG